MDEERKEKHEHLDGCGYSGASVDPEGRGACAYGCPVGGGFVRPPGDGTLLFTQKPTLYYFDGAVRPHEEMLARTRDLFLFTQLLKFSLP